MYMNVRNSTEFLDHAFEIAGISKTALLRKNNRILVLRKKLQRWGNAQPRSHHRLYGVQEILEIIEVQYIMSTVQSYTHEIWKCHFSSHDEDEVQARG